MLLRLRILVSSISFSGLIMLALCLGAQNLNERENLKLGIAETVPLPTGFLVGTSMALGVICGGFTTALFLPGSEEKK